MSWFDIIVILVLLGAFIRGIQKGLIMQLAGLVALTAGAIFAGRLANIVLPFLLNTVNISANIAAVLSYVLAFAIIVICIKIIGKYIHSSLKALQLSFLNKILGSFLGVLSASLVLSILVNLAIMLDIEEDIITDNIKNESCFYPEMQKIAPIIVPYLKEEIWEKHIQKRVIKDKLEHENDKQNELSILAKTNNSNYKILNLQI